MHVTSLPHRPRSNVYLNSLLGGLHRAAYRNPPMEVLLNYPMDGVSIESLLCGLEPGQGRDFLIGVDEDSASPVGLTHAETTSAWEMVNEDAGQAELSGSFTLQPSLMGMENGDGETVYVLLVEVRRRR